MYDQRPMEMLGSYVAAMIIGAMIYAATRYYGDVRANNAVKAQGEQR